MASSGREMRRLGPRRGRPASLRRDVQVLCKLSLQEIDRKVLTEPLQAGTVA
jgi:hypothetical protein